MKLITYQGVKGYRIRDIKKLVGKKIFKKFDDFMYGKTVMRYKGEDFICVTDWQQFIRIPL